MNLRSIKKLFHDAANSVAQNMTKSDTKEAAIQAISEREKGINLTLCVLAYLSLC